MLYCIIKVRNRGVTVYQVALSPSPYHSGPDYYHCNHFPQNTFKSLHFVGGSYTLTIIVSHLPPTTCYSTMSRCVMFVCNRAQLISTNQSMFFQDKAWLKLPVFYKSVHVQMRNALVQRLPAYLCVCPSYYCWQWKTSPQASSCLCSWLWRRRKRFLWWNILNMDWTQSTFMCRYSEWSAINESVCQLWHFFESECCVTRDKLWQGRRFIPSITSCCSSWIFRLSSVWSSSSRRVR